MKGIVLIACVGSAAAALAPQFPNAFPVAAGSTVVERPFSVCVQTIATGTSLCSALAGVAPGEFVITDVVVCAVNGFSTASGLVHQVRISANGALACVTQGTSMVRSYEVSGQTSGAHFQHGVVVPAGSQILVESAAAPAFVTLAGYLR